MLLACGLSWEPVLLCQCVQINSVGNIDGKLDEMARETSVGKLKVVILREEKDKRTVSIISGPGHWLELRFSA